MSAEKDPYDLDKQSKNVLLRLIKENCLVSKRDIARAMWQEKVDQVAEFNQRAYELDFIGVLDAAKACSDRGDLSGYHRNMLAYEKLSKTRDKLLNKAKRLDIAAENLYQSMSKL